MHFFHNLVISLFGRVFGDMTSAVLLISSSLVCYVVLHTCRLVTFVGSLTLFSGWLLWEHQKSTPLFLRYFVRQFFCNLHPMCTYKFLAQIEVYAPFLFFEMRSTAKYCTNVCIFHRCVGPLMSHCIFIANSAHFLDISCLAFPLLQKFL